MLQFFFLWAHSKHTKPAFLNPVELQYNFLNYPGANTGEILYQLLLLGAKIQVPKLKKVKKINI